MTSPIPVVVNGATGKMGREIIKAVAAAEDMTLVGAIARNRDLQGEDIGEVIGCGALEVPIIADLQATLAMAGQEREPFILQCLSANQLKATVRRRRKKVCTEVFGEDLIRRKIFRKWQVKT